MSHGSSGYSMSRHRKAWRGSLASQRGDQREQPREMPRRQGKRPKRPVHKASAPLMRDGLAELDRIVKAAHAAFDADRRVWDGVEGGRL